MLSRLLKKQRGITGLETAIILIAFVVVASVFAYTVLSAGIFSSEKGKEAIHSGLETARSSMSLSGGVVARDIGDDNDVDRIIFTVTNALEGEPIDLTQTTDSDSDGLLSDEASKSHVLIVTYIDKNQRFEDIAWTATQVGKGDSDNLLEPGEKFEITVNVARTADSGPLTTALTGGETFTLELKPEKGSALVIERTLPTVIDIYMNLN